MSLKNRPPARNRASALFAALFLLAAAAPLLSPPPAGATEGYRQGRVTMPGGGTIGVDIADTEAKRRLGLSGRESLARDRGMLFLFPEVALHPFWMKEMRFPIDIVWLRNTTVVSVAANAPPPAPGERPATLDPGAEANIVLEVPAGMAEEFGLRPGARVRYQL